MLNNTLNKSASTRQAEAINQSADGLNKGAKVWVRGTGSHEWEIGDIRTFDGHTAQVALERNGKLVSAVKENMVPANPRLQEGIPDLTHLTHLNEPGILYNLNTRYGGDDIYTFAGPVLIAVNPCKPLQLYTPEIANQYKAGARDIVQSANMDPHIYLVAASAYRRMVREKTSQSLIVNGESGAGKTETTKKAMQYFATLAGGTGVEDQVLETNPILEAFGNAKTLRNHNSSRFGKLIQIHFNQGNSISGAAIKTYLLEKSRVVHQLKGERSYHIFYQLVKGADAEQKKTFRLPNKPDDFKYLSSSGCTAIDGVDDVAEFKSVCHAMADIGIDYPTQAALFKLLSGILWLGNLNFARDEAHQDNDVTIVVQDAACEAVCDLLGVTWEQLTRALTRKKIVAPGEIVIKVLNMEESKDCRDALAKALYAAVFDWIVARINDKLDSKGRAGTALSIAILDIYGFEQFQTNSFEQLCINYANERLQQQFTRHLFTLEQLEYESEGIDWTKVEFIDNYECVDVIEATPPKGLGVLAILDAQCKFPKATDEAFSHKLKETLTNHSHFGVNPRNPNLFTILHYAGAVTYNCNGFLDKNKDTLNQDLVELMLEADAACSPLVPVLGQQVKDDLDVVSKKGQTVGSRFSLQLKDLISELDATGLHFVRCIKPNSKLAPGLWEEGMVLHQLRCCGVLEVARIARAGYPTRYTHQAFAERYAILLPREQQAELLAVAAQRNSNPGSADAATSTGALSACRQLLSKFGLTKDQYQVGATKVFFRPGALGVVEDRWAAMQASALRIQTFYRMHLARSKYLKIQWSAQLVQSGWRARKDRMEYTVLVTRARAATLIQAQWRAYHARKEYLAMRAATISIQMGWRRARFAMRVQKRVREREAREEAERIEQGKFDNLRLQFGCEMDDVREALKAWTAARELAAAGGAANGTVDSAAMIAAMAQMQAKQNGFETQHYTPDGQAVLANGGSLRRLASLRVSVNDVEHAAAKGMSPGMGPLCRMCGQQINPDENCNEVPEQLDQEAAVASPPGSARSPFANNGLQPAASFKRTFSNKPQEVTAEMQAKLAMAQETQEMAEKLQMENIRLSKQLQLERSLKDRYQHKYEEQNQMWMQQLGLLQEYILEVRSAFGDAKLPPLPSALASAGVALPMTVSTGTDAADLQGKASSQFSGSLVSDHAADPTPFRGAPAPAPVSQPTTATSAGRGSFDKLPSTNSRTPPNPNPPGLPPAPSRRGIMRAPQLGAHNHGGPSDDDESGQDSTPRANPGGMGWDRRVPNRNLRLDVDQEFDDGSSGGVPSDQYNLASPARPVQPVYAQAQEQRRAPGLQRAQLVRGGAPLPTQQPPGARQTGPAAKYVDQLGGEFGKVQQVLDDDVDFIGEVASGYATAPDMDPAQELIRLKRKFELWRKGFQDKITTAEEVLKKLDRMGGIPPTSQSRPVYMNGGMSAGPAQPMPGGYPVAQTPKQGKGVMGKLFGR